MQFVFPACRALALVFRGAYKNLFTAYDKLRDISTTVIHANIHFINTPLRK